MTASELAYRNKDDGSGFDFTQAGTQDLLDRAGVDPATTQIAVGGPDNINACFYGRLKVSQEGILVFRGILPPEAPPDDWQKWIEIALDSLQDGDTVPDHFEPIRGLVHEGLHEALATLFDRIQQWDVAQTPCHICRPTGPIGMAARRA